ncbi:MAG: response regulator, partial [Hymenobacter sp.]
MATACTIPKSTLCPLPSGWPPATRSEPCFSPLAPPPLTVLILEDEYPAAERLQWLLAQAAPGAQVLAVLDTVAGALAWLAAHPAPDLILSDIQLADGLSLDVFAQTLV